MKFNLRLYSYFKLLSQNFGDASFSDFIYNWHELFVKSKINQKFDLNLIRTLLWIFQKIQFEFFSQLSNILSRNALGIILRILLKDSTEFLGNYNLKIWFPWNSSQNPVFLGCLKSEDSIPNPLTFVSELSSKLNSFKVFLRMSFKPSPACS